MANLETNSSVTVNSKGISYNNTSSNNTSGKEDTHDKPSDREDSESIIGRFGWTTVGECHLPYIIRVINGEFVHYTSVRIAESQLLNNYLNHLNVDIFDTCTSVRGYHLSRSESELLNHINLNHCNQLYGKKEFQAGKDYIVCMEDVQEFYAFIKYCCKKLFYKTTLDCVDKCGFICIDSQCYLPFCNQDNQKYVPLFYFEGEIDNLRRRGIVKLENWNLAHLKFCCMVQGIMKKLFASDSCDVISIDIIKDYYSPETRFEDFWPVKIVDVKLLIKEVNTEVHPPGAWIRVPPTAMNILPVQENILSCSSTTQNSAMASILIPPLSHDIHRKIWWDTDHMNSAIIQNIGSSMNNLSTMASVVQNTVSNTAPNVEYGGQSMTANESYGIEYVDPPHIAYITPDQFTRPRPQNNALRNTTTPVASEIVDLTSPPSSPGPRQFSQDTVRTGDGWNLQSIYDRQWDHGPRDSAPYRLLKSTLEGKMINCINVDPYIYTDLLVTLHDVTQRVLPLCSVSRCAHILGKYLNIQLHQANFVQTSLLRQHGYYRFFCPEKSPLLRLQDLYRVLLELKYLGGKSDQEIERYQNKVKRYPRKY